MRSQGWKPIAKKELPADGEATQLQGRGPTSKAKHVESLSRILAAVVGKQVATQGLGSQDGGS